jgi:hypothetical protein
MPTFAILFLMSTSIYLLLMLILAAAFAGGLYLATRGSKQIDQGRRSFLTGGGHGNGEHALFFGMQLVIQVFGGDELRARLVRLLQAEETSAQDKRRTMKSLAALLVENRYAWEYGFWEFSSDADTAISNYSQWQNEIEASMATEADEMGEEVDRLHRYSDQKEYLILTLMLLLDNSDEPVADDHGDIRFRPAYSQLALPFRQLCEHFDESEYWTPETFARLLDGIRALDPRVIERDGVFVYPGAEQDGVSSLDLLGDASWKYLTDHSLRVG